MDDIFVEIRVIKGVFYYYFKNKDEMGLVLINELMCFVVLLGFSIFLGDGNMVDIIVMFYCYFFFENVEL